MHTWTYRVLKHRAHEIAVALRAAGHGPGSRVAVIGSMTPEAVATYLAVVLVGGAVVSVADSFSPEEMTVRLNIAEATLIIVQVRHGPKGPPCKTLSATVTLWRHPHAQIPIDLRNDN